MIVPLPLHSTYSLLRGTIPPRILASEARRLGYSALALTDRDSLYGLPVFLEAMEAEGLRPIIGTEVGYEGGTCVLLAKDRGGFARLCRLLTARAGCLPGATGTGAARAGPALEGAATEGGAGPRDRASLAVWLEEEGSEGLVALSDDLLLLPSWRGRPDRWALLRPAAKPAWKKLLASGVPPAAGAEVAYLGAADREVQRLLLAVGKRATVWDVADSELAPATALLEAPELAEAAFGDCPRALEGNAAVADACRFSTLFEGWRFPSWPTEHPGGSLGLLGDLVEKGLGERLGGPPPEAYRKRAAYELGIIGEKGFADYFLVVRDIVRRASRTCGRGSAAASVVSWALGITAVDPLLHDLYFERFLNPGRKDPPDIDVDFAWDERDDLLEEVEKAYGEAHAARVANHVCFKRRGALREAARAFGMTDSEISDRERVLVHDPGGRAGGADATWKEIVDLAARITGFPRNLGVHSGGLVVVPGELGDIVPLERSGGGIRITAWDKEGVEAAGLVKIDLLGNRSLAVVRDARANLVENGCRPPGDEEALADEATIGLLARGDTMGVFYVESPAMRQLQLKAGAGDFAHLVIHSSIIRPAANRYIDEYIDRLKGKEWGALHPLLEGILDETFGIMCYQEDVSKVAVALAGFSPAEADGMRKVLSKKDAATRLDSFKPKFAAGARARGVGDETIKEAWAMIQSFAGYSFVKAHSASYALLSFQSAWLRAHHPAEFMAAVISNRGGYYSVLAYASEARRMGLRLLGPSVEESGVRCRGRSRELRFGLGLVAGLGQATAERIVAERERRGPYADLDDFARRVGPDRDEAAALAGSGALDGLAPPSGPPPGAPLRRSERLMRLLALGAEPGGSAERGLGPGLFETEPPAPRAAASTEPPRSRAGGRERALLETELRLLGTTLEVHPLVLWPAALSSPRVLARDLGDHVGETVRLAAWPITAKEVLAKGEHPMEFVSFEDETALFEAVLFPESYRRYGGLLSEERPFFLVGKVALDRGALSLELLHLEKVPREAPGRRGEGQAARPGKSFYGRYW